LNTVGPCVGWPCLLIYGSYLQKDLEVWEARGTDPQRKKTKNTGGQ
jgi:hypothetical protein